MMDTSGLKQRFNHRRTWMNGEWLVMKVSYHKAFVHPWTGDSVILSPSQVMFYPINWSMHPLRHVDDQERRGRSVIVQFFISKKVGKTGRKCVCYGWKMKKVGFLTKIQITQISFGWESSRLADRHVSSLRVFVYPRTFQCRISPKSEVARTRLLQLSQMAFHIHH